VGRLLAILAAVVINGGLLIAIFGYLALRAYEGAGPLPTQKRMVIEYGTGVPAIGRELEEAGVVSDARLFRLAVRLEGKGDELKAGEYDFPAEISLAQTVAALVRGPNVSRRITVPEGLTSAQVVLLIEAADGLRGHVSEIPPEGTLLPETYSYTWNDDRQAIVRRMRQAMDQTLAELWEQRAPDLPFKTPEEAVTMASIVEKETGVARERPLVASVFMNRLRRGMRLQSDPTVIYALTAGKGPLDRPLTRADWQVDSPYNTYVVAGLPAGPIANPGRESLQAVLNPVDSDYLYFVADGSGGHAFARSLDEHNRNVARWRRGRDSVAN